jgi:hypothetical protein
MSKKLLISKDELLLDQTIDYIKNSFEQVDEPEDQSIGWDCIKWLKKIKRQISKSERSTLPRKDETPFNVDSRVWHPEFGFGTVLLITARFKGYRSLSIKLDIPVIFRGKVYHQIIPDKYLFHASDPCIAIFGIEPEGGKK